MVLEIRLPDSSRNFFPFPPENCLPRRSIFQNKLPERVDANQDASIEPCPTLKSFCSYMHRSKLRHGWITTVCRCWNSLLFSVRALCSPLAADLVVFVFLMDEICYFLLLLCLLFSRKRRFSDSNHLHDRFVWRDC